MEQDMPTWCDLRYFHAFYHSLGLKYEEQADIIKNICV